ncbi:hypothetical protein NGRA_0999 [Nosema granulosis]|uniref:Uncharacterized protein n=1 Tax=Nosema granulosis TaxID=83296 RepID=A0A9P6KZ26_9MICR|nr:hypothetical protein NGRA_0999 [Nosema granulosis]
MKILGDLLSMSIFLYTYFVCILDCVFYRRLILLVSMGLFSRFSKFMFTLVFILVVYLLLSKYIGWVKCFVENKRVGNQNESFKKVVEIYITGESLMLGILNDNNDFR